MKPIRIGNFTFGKRTPNQYDLGKGNNMIGSFIGMGFNVVEYDLYSQIKDYRTDLLNGTNWRPTNANDLFSLSYMQFLNLLSKYSTAIFNDFNRVGFAVFARIDDRIFYISANNYNRNERKVTVRNYPDAEVFLFDEPNAFCGEKTITQKIEPFQRLYNIALSCQKNGMSKSGFVTMISPKAGSGANTAARLTDDDILAMEKSLSEGHGVSTDEQNNIILLRNEINVNTITFDFAKLGILETKKLCEEFVCSKMGVPYVLLPSSGQTFENYQTAKDILMENHSRYCEFFTKFAKRELGFDIDYKTIEKTETAITQV